MFANYVAIVNTLFKNDSEYFICILHNTWKRVTVKEEISISDPLEERKSERSFLSKHDVLNRTFRFETSVPFL